MSAVLIAKSEIGSELKIPFYLSAVSAGFPSPAQDYVEKTLDLNELLISRPSATYFVRAEGDSMLGAGIHDGDILIVDRSLTAKHGDVVIASLQGELTVKQLALYPSCQLSPRNKRYKPIPIKEESDLELFGVVTNVIHQFR
ncbi:MAG: translesion error-prone DNA polymerase V autoproteolytic subunit [Neptuniibacter sp.]